MRALQGRSGPVRTEPVTLARTPQTPGKEGTIWANGVYPLTIDFSEACLPCEPRSVCAALSACIIIAPLCLRRLCMLLMRF